MYDEGIQAMYAVRNNIARTGWIWIFYILLPAWGQCQQARLEEEIRKILRYEQPVDFHVVPGILVGIIDGDNTYLCAFGDTVRENAVFESGSLTKPVVAWLAEQALDSLHLDLTTPVCQFLPETLCTEDLNRITVGHLLQHRAGLDRLPAGIGRYEKDVTDPYTTYSFENLATDIADMAAIPGKYSYSHTGYAMLHWLFERVGGTDDFLERRLTKPFQLSQTGFRMRDSRVWPGHGMDGRKQPPWHTGALTTALGLRSDIHDMMKFISMISPEMGRRIPAFTRDMKRELKSWRRAGAYRVEQGWFLVQSGRGWIWYHNGRTGGHHVSVAFSPHLSKGVVVCSTGTMGSGELSLRILDMLRREKK